METNTKKIYLILFMISLGHFLVDFMIGILPVYKTMMELDIAKAGLIAGVCAFLGEGVQVFFGPLGDKGYRKSLVLFGVLAAAATTGLAYTQDYFVIFALYLVTCIGSGAFHPSAVSMISNLTTTQKSLFIGIFASAGAFGLAASQIVYSNTFEYINGNTLILALPSLCLVLIMARQLMTSTTAKTSAGFSLSLFANFFKQPDLRRLYIISVCNQSIAWGLIFLLPDTLRSKGYDSWVYLGGGHLWFILGGSCMLIPGSYLADKFSPKSVLIGAITICTAAFYVFLLSPQLSTIALCSLLFVLGSAMYLVNPVSVAFGNRLMPSHPGVVNACLMGLVWCIAEGIGQTGGGYLTTFFPQDGPIYALIILGSMSILSLWAAMTLPKDVQEISIEYA